MSKYEDLVAAVRAALSTVADSKTLTAQGRSALIEGTAALTGISRGSMSYQLRTALEALSAAIQAAERAENVEASVLEAMGAYVSEISGGGSPASVTPKEAEPARRAQPRTPRGPDGKIDFRALLEKLKAQGVVGFEGRTIGPIPDFVPDVTNPACYQGLAPRQGPARGNLFYPNGRKWNNTPIESTGGTSAFDLDKIRPAYRGFKPADGHLEGNVVAWMIDNQVREMVLYVNEHVCSHQGRGCLPTLKLFLPKGYTLHVHARNSEGKWKYDVFHGTGTAFQDRPE